VPESAEDLDLMIAEYLDARLGPARHSAFEARLARDPELQLRLEEARRVVGLVQQAIPAYETGAEFENQVDRKITHITQNNPDARPFEGDPLHGASLEESLAAELARDAGAQRERGRLLALATVGAGLILAAAAAVGYVMWAG
jgi:anti-sigma factor RsiW